MRITKTSAFKLTIMLGLVLTCSIAEAQKNEGPVGIFDTRQEYNEFMGGLKSLRDPDINAMLPTINDMALGQPIGQTAQQYSIGGGNPVMTMLSNGDIRNDLEIVDEQMDSLEQVNREFQKRVASEMRSVDMSDASDVLKRMRGLTDAAKAEMEGVFLPHQLERLGQLGMQQQMNRKGVLGALLTDPLASQLEITEKQKAELREAAKEIEKELAKEMAALRAKARKKLFSKLNSDQRKELEDLIGDEYQFAKSNGGIVSGTSNQRFKSKGREKQKEKGEKKRKL